MLVANFLYAFFASQNTRWIVNGQSNFSFFEDWPNIYKSQLKPDKRLPELSSLNLHFFDIFVSTFSTSLQTKLYVCGKINVKYLHELTETLFNSLCFSHLIPETYLEPSRTSMKELFCKNPKGFLVFSCFCKRLHQKCLTRF